MPTAPRIYPDLRTSLKAMGETQEEFASRLGISQSFVSDLMNGKRTPTLALALRIARAARIPVESLVSGDGL